MKRYFYSTRRAAAELHVSRRHFYRVAELFGVEPLIFHGVLLTKMMWTAPMVALLRRARRLG